MLAPVRVSPPASEPVTVAEVKAHCNVETDRDDILIAGLIAAATAHLDGHTGILGRALVTQTWRQDFPEFGNVMRLPLRPAASVSSIAYYDAENAQQTVDAAVYGLFTDTAGPYVALQPSQSWPAVYARRDAVSVTFVAGDASPPAPIKVAVLLLVAHWYANREAVVIGGTPIELPLAVRALLDPYVVWTV